MCGQACGCTGRRRAGTIEGMHLRDIVSRSAPQPWVDGEKIPWHEPGFSARMLREHLSQAHDAASRRFALIDGHVGWLHAAVLGGKPSRILDLGCGPGLYLNRLAHLGHTGTGIDFSPASIAYAQEEAQAQRLPVVYRLEDLRTAAFRREGEMPYDLALLIYGEFNTFRREDARRILRKAWDALRPGGWLLLEPSTFASVRALGTAGPSWYAAASGLWSARPHVVLQDNAWDAQQRAAVERYVIVDAESGALAPHAMTTQAYDEEELVQMLGEPGFANICIQPALPRWADTTSGDTADDTTDDTTDNTDERAAGAAGTASEQAPFYAVWGQKVD